MFNPDCRICQRPAGAREQKTSRAATREQGNATGRTRAVLSPFPGMKVPWLRPLPSRIACPPGQLHLNRVEKW